MANYLDETGLQTLRNRIEAVYKRRDDMIGTVMWWSGSISSIPSNAKICNGRTLSRIDFATLYTILGLDYVPEFSTSAAYAVGDYVKYSNSYYRFTSAHTAGAWNSSHVTSDATKFCIPDLRTSSDYGRFIRARFKDIGSGEGQITLANITQEDAIRNINGNSVNGSALSFSNQQDASTLATGAFQYDYAGGDRVGSGGGWYKQWFSFNANRGRVVDNPMAGHANGDDIHPHNISMIPIIIVS